MKYDIFISYRREGGYDTAKHLNDLLTRDGYKVSFDIDTLRNGDFDTQLLTRIEECQDFILIVDAHAFDRTLDPNFDTQKDWVRCELAHALKHNKNIIPVFLSGVSSFPENLPEDIAGVATKNGPEYTKYYFNEFYNKLKKDFLLSRRNRRWYFFFFLLFLILLFIGGYFTYNDYQKYNERIISLIENTINTDTNTGVAFLCEALPNYLHKKDKFSILRETDKIKPTTIDNRYKLFNDDCITINEDASTIATSEYGNSIYLLGIETNKITTIDSKHLPLIGSRSIAFNPTRKNIAIAVYNYPHLKIVVHDLESHEEVYYQDLGNKNMENIKYKNDYIVLYGFDGITLIDINTGIIDDTIINESKTVENVEFNATGDKIYIALEGQIILYDINEKCITSKRYTDVDWRSVMSVADDAGHIYVGYNKHISKLNSSTLELVKELNIPNNIRSIKFFKDDTIIYGDDKGGLHKLDFLSETDFQYESIHKDAITRIAINNQGQIYSYSKGVLGVNNDYFSGIWMDCLHKDNLCYSHVNYKDSLSLVANDYGDIVMCKLGSNNSSTIKLRDLCKGSFSRYDDVRCIQYSDSIYLFVAGRDMILYDLKNDEVLDSIEDEYFDDIILNDSLVYATSYDTDILMWGIDKLRFTPLTYITPDSKLEDDIKCISVMNASGSILYSVGNKLFLYDITMHNSTLLHIAAEDIEGIIPCRDNKKILIHNDEDDIEIFQFGVDGVTYIPTDIYQTKRFAISPNSDLLFGGDSNKIHVWNTNTGKLLKTYTTDYVIEQLYFNMQTNQLIILTHNYGLLSWDVLLNEDEVNELIETHRELTEEEKETYKINSFYSLF